MNATFHLTYRIARRIVIGIVGTTVVLVGIVMLVTPGPGLAVIPAGLAILGLEFAFARRWLQKVRERISRRNARLGAEAAESHRQSPGKPGEH